MNFNTLTGVSPTLTAPITRQPKFSASPFYKADTVEFKNNKEITLQSKRRELLESQWKDIQLNGDLQGISEPLSLGKDMHPLFGLFKKLTGKLLYINKNQNFKQPVIHNVSGLEPVIPRYNLKTSSLAFLPGMSPAETKVAVVEGVIRSLQILQKPLEVKLSRKIQNLENELVVSHAENVDMNSKDSRQGFVNQFKALSNLSEKNRQKLLLSIRNEKQVYELMTGHAEWLKAASPEIEQGVKEWNRKKHSPFKGSLEAKIKSMLKMYTNLETLLEMDTEAKPKFSTHLHTKLIGLLKRKQ